MNVLLPTVLGLFLYFPEDKSEYFPAAISFTIFMIACVFTMRWIIKKSRKEELKTKNLEEEVTRRNQHLKKNSLH
ncbi:MULTISPECIES: hypothetical protein [Bacillaceae]|uniref:Uncharacterized protein n=1 Tax=Peribacillus huizhouensis TaxID=1501239 RepID=A0ABR6CPI3_9BACI|nr:MULTISPECIES: hypothetical protein [Bacillaceae]MBA9026935.1 hypothetical protein [Peribacillus huizhouensis]